MKSILSVGALALFVSSSLLANGWECVQKDKGPHAVTLYNYVSKDETKLPAVARMTDGDENEVFAVADAIKMDTKKAGEFQANQNEIKTNKVYTILTPHLTHDRTEVAKIELWVNGNQDSEKLAYKQLRSGRVKMFSKETGKQLTGAKQVIELSCQYYLKGERHAAVSTPKQIQQLQQQHQKQIDQGQIDQVQQQK